MVLLYDAFKSSGIQTLAHVQFHYVQFIIFIISSSLQARNVVRGPRFCRRHHSIYLNFEAHNSSRFRVLPLFVVNQYLRALKIY